MGSGGGRDRGEGGSFILCPGSPRDIGSALPCLAFSVLGQGPKTLEVLVQTMVGLEGCHFLALDSFARSVHMSPQGLVSSEHPGPQPKGPSLDSIL